MTSKSFGRFKSAQLSATPASSHYYCDHHPAEHGRDRPRPQQSALYSRVSSVYIPFCSHVSTGSVTRNLSPLLKRTSTGVGSTNCPRLLIVTTRSLHLFDRDVILPVVHVPSAPEPAQILAAFALISRKKSEGDGCLNAQSLECTCGTPSRNAPAQGSARAAAPCRTLP